jgi:fimbrial chaperone protein
MGNIRRRLILIQTLMTFFLAAQAYGFKLTPMSISFESEGREATRGFVVENESPEKIAVQVSMVQRKMDLDGKEEHPSAEKEFTVYPQQLILGPSEKRTIRATWIGPKEPPIELAYRIVVEQLPVQGLKKEARKKAEIQILLRYEGSIYILPKDPHAHPEVEVVSTELLPGKDKKSAQIALTLENKGSLHQILNEPVLKIFPKDKTSGEPITFGTSELKTLDGQNVLAGSKRRFLIPLKGPKNLPEGPIQAQLNLKQ